MAANTNGVSRLGQQVRAVRPALPGRLMLVGPSGSGKTRSGLTIATSLAETEPGGILVIDTESESATTYADDFEFEHLPWRAPFDPRDLAATLVAIDRQEFAVVMIDSMTHFWRKEGGTLQIADGKFGGWKVARPAQEQMVEAMLACKAHVIGCVRAKTTYVQEQEANGKYSVRKLGMEAQQDDTLEYEMNLVGDIDLDHKITVTKSRTTVLPTGRVFQSGGAELLAETYRDWLAGGADRIEAVIAEDWTSRMNACSEAANVKRTFYARFGRPDMVLVEQADECEAWIVSIENPSPEELPAG
jgi:energy-coupling factor transporter ATP-binding protein EcfA2